MKVNVPRKIFLVFILLVIGTSFVIFVDGASVPSWIKNNAKWWAEGQITESDYLSSLQYLVNQGILVIPITEVTAASTNSDNKIAHSFVVHFSNGLISKPITFTTFSKFQITSSTIDEQRSSFPVYKFSDNPEFFLESIPSIDKKEFYIGVDRWMTKSNAISPFDVNIDVISSDGRIIQTWKFSKCDLTGYGTYLQDVRNLYQFSNNDEMAEIRERTTFVCQGIKLTTP
ncbi:MAG TPA: hypothetical protein VLD38_06865 [Nitrosopumilaceae archaeon]|nr:hypothetical protein [Nitrosopumilaceae archaeon]